MDDFRFLEDNSLWIIVIIIFLLLLFGNGGCSSFNLDCLGNLFNGCGCNSWLWIVIIVAVIYFLSHGSCGSIFRNDLQ